MSCRRTSNIAQAQPPELDVAGADDVMTLTTITMPGAAAFGCSALLAVIFVMLSSHQSRLQLLLSNPDLFLANLPKLPDNQEWNADLKA